MKEHLCCPVAESVAVAGCWQLLSEVAGSPFLAELWLKLCLHVAWQCSSELKASALHLQA